MTWPACEISAERRVSHSRRITGGARSTVDLMPSEVRRLKQLEEENGRLKRMVADLSL